MALTKIDLSKQLEEMAKALGRLESADLMKVPTRSFAGRYEALLHHLKQESTAEHFPPEIPIEDGTPQTRYVELLTYINQAIEIANAPPEA